MSNRDQLDGRKISLFEVKVGAFPQMAALVFPDPAANKSTGCKKSESE